MIPQETIETWQTVWKIILDMAYHRKNITSSVEIKHTNIYDCDLMKFDHMWKKYSCLKDDNGNYIEPKVVPELKTLTIPAKLFECPGSNTLLKTCFPDCKVTFW